MALAGAGRREFTGRFGVGFPRIWAVGVGGEELEDALRGRRFESEEGGE